MALCADMLVAAGLPATTAHARTAASGAGQWQGSRDVLAMVASTRVPPTFMGRYDAYLPQAAIVRCPPNSVPDGWRWAGHGRMGSGRRRARQID